MAARKKNSKALPWGIDDLIKYCERRRKSDFRFVMMAVYLRELKGIRNICFDGNLNRLTLQCKEMERRQARRTKKKP